MKSAKYILSAGLIIIIITSMAWVKPDNKYFEIARNLDIFVTLFKEVNAFYVDEVEPEKIIRVGIDAMLSSLDPYTNFIPEDDLDAYSTMITGQYAGIGSMIGVINGKVMITMPNEGFPADNAGIKIGDEIISVDGIEVTAKSTTEVSKLLKGAAGTQVIVTVKRIGVEKPIDFIIKRAQITLDNVPYYGIINGDKGYIKLAEFTTNASKEVKKAVIDLKTQGARSIILDVRGNPGGLLHEAVNICNVFIPKGKVVVETRGKVTQWNQVYKTLNSPVDTEIPLIVLTSQGSASAAEIVSGTLQDYDRGVLIGRKTFGKGLVQTTRPVAYNSQLKVTTAKYYIPSGRCIQALDYTHRNEDGSVGKIADSLKVAFRTANGRIVYDGGGVDPDLHIRGEYLSSLAISLLNNGLIFEYATIYANQHDTIPDIQEIRLSDEEYNQFVSWLKDKTYDYSSRLESSINTLEEAAKAEDYFDQIEDEILALRAEVAHNTSQDLVSFKDELKEILSEQISGHYHYRQGEIAASLKYDPDVQAAVEVLNDPVSYRNLLTQTE
jgi:carboxyl-terminal processing protease